MIRKAPNEKGSIIFLPGKSEPVFKYAELLYDLRDLGYSYYLMDHRGMGMSDKIILGTDKSHVKKFDNYITDLKYFIDTIVQPKTNKKLYAVSHSMGGAILTKYLVTYKDNFNRIVLASPMLKIETGFPEVLAELVLALGSFIGLSENFAPGEKPWSKFKFDEKALTSSEARWWMANVFIKNKYPQTISGGATVGWVKDCIAGSQEARNNGW